MNIVAYPDFDPSRLIVPPLFKQTPSNCVCHWLPFQENSRGAELRYRYESPVYGKEFIDQESNFLAATAQETRHEEISRLSIKMPKNINRQAALTSLLKELVRCLTDDV